MLRVIDGVTVDFCCPDLCDIRARLVGFDRPELFLPECPFEVARAVAVQTALRWYLRSVGKLQIVMGGWDRYDRGLMKVFVDVDCLANLMIASVHAWAQSGGARGGWCA